MASIAICYICESLKKIEIAEVLCVQERPSGPASIGFGRDSMLGERS
jgi:hypothetical protein